MPEPPFDHMRVPEMGPRLPVPHEQIPEAAAHERAHKLAAPYVDGLSRPEIREVVRGACIANDLIQVANADSWDDAATKAVESFGGRAMLVARVAGLAKDMADARSSTDQAAQAAVFLLCERV
jgi:hypothetical protein